MDEFDRKILRLLTQNARMTGADIARKVNLSIPAVTERLRKLGRSGMIEKYTVKLNRAELSLNLLAFVQVWNRSYKAFECQGADRWSGRSVGMSSYCGGL